MKIGFSIDINNVVSKLWKLLNKINIAHILLIFLALHLFLMSQPGDSFIFDEAHYVPASVDTLHLIAANAEHPPLTKIIIGVSIGIFGNWWFAWRLPALIFSTLSLYIVYLIAQKYLSKKQALASTLILGLDTLFFVNMGIALLDPPEMFFSLVGILWFLDKKYVKSSFIFAIAFLCLERAMFFVIGLGILFAITQLVAMKKPSLHLHKSNIHWKSLLKLKTIFLSFIVFTSVVLGGLYVYDTIYKPSSSAVLQTQVAATVFVDNASNPVTTSYSTTNVTSQMYITNPIQHILFGLRYYTALTPSATGNLSESNFRPPWSWTLPIINAFNPPHYLTTSISINGVTTGIIFDWVSQISWPIAITFWIVFALCCYNLLKKRSIGFSSLYIAWSSGTYLPWLIFGAFVQKMTFNYYFLLTTPILAMGVPFLWQSLPIPTKAKRIGLAVHIIIIGIYFIYYLPINLFRA